MKKKASEAVSFVRKSSYLYTGQKEKNKRFLLTLKLWKSKVLRLFFA